jgi:anti-sigma factor RsiW
VKSSAKPRREHPSDLELMMYADGELDPERRAEVAAYLDRTPSARSKLRAMEVTGALVRGGGEGSSPLADGIADAVMARLDQALPEGEQRPSEASVVPIAAAKPRAASEKVERRSGRSIFALAGLAAAAAAALLVWSKSPAPNGGDERAVSVSPEASEEQTARRQAPPSPSQAVADPAGTAPSAEAQADVESPVSGVELAAVEFGKRMGSIFFVPSEAAASSPMTMVVWLADDALEED